MLWSPRNIRKKEESDFWLLAHKEIEILMRRRYGHRQRTCDEGRVYFNNNHPNRTANKFMLCWTVQQHEAS